MPGAPLPSDETARLAELRRYAILDTPSEASFDQLTQLAAYICQTPVSLVSLVDKNRQWFKSKQGIEISETPRDQAFCGYTILSDEPFIISDAATDERVQSNPLVTCEPNIRFYAGVPLITAQGYRLGSLCVIDYVPRELSTDQLNGLKSLAQQVVVLLENQRYSERLMEYATALEDARTRAVQASQAKSDFLSKVNHELRTPLNAILGFTELLSQSEALSMREQQYTAIITQSGEHLLSLIQSMLDMSQIESRQIVCEEVECDLHQLIHEVINMFQLQARKKGLFLKIEGIEAIPQRIRTDARKLRQILINLLGNAIKFTDNGSITLQTTIIDADPIPSASLAKVTCLFEIKDTGPGIDPHEIPVIFDAFGQASAGRHNSEGIGLGLTISQQFARALGGDITVSSVLGQGTCFRVSIQASTPNVASPCS